MKVAIVGAGWAGCAATLALARQGHHATVFEASRVLGGRARAAFDYQGQALDNGQHILIGAYTETLQLMASVGIDLDTALLALPLSLRFADGGGLQMPRLRPPLDAAVGILRAVGWSWGDKFSLLRAAMRWRRNGFACNPHDTVDDLCTGISPRVMAELLEPLCVSALNTPATQASGQVFLTVLRDSLFAAPTRLGPGSTLLLPKVDLGTLFPVAAVKQAGLSGAQLRLAERVHHIQPAREKGCWQVNGEAFDRVVLACPAAEAARLVVANGINPAWAACADALQYEAIATVYAQSPGARLALPMLALRSTASAPAQFAFDRGQLGGPPGLLAFVVSASRGAPALLEQQVLAQAESQLALRGLEPVRTIVEKRATFACTPGLLRPGPQIADGLWACGDYVQGPYPATLEGAVRSALALRI